MHVRVYVAPGEGLIDWVPESGNEDDMPLQDESFAVLLIVHSIVPLLLLRF